MRKHKKTNKKEQKKETKINLTKNKELTNQFSLFLLTPPRSIRPQDKIEHTNKQTGKTYRTNLPKNEIKNKQNKDGKKYKKEEKNKQTK